MSASDVAMFGWPIYSDEGVLLSPTLDGGDWVASGSIALANVQEPRMERVARSTSLDLQDTRLRCDLKTDRLVRVIALPKTTLSQSAHVRFLGVPSSLLFDYEAGDDIVARGGTFTRATAATYFDRSGVLRTAASGIPRDSHFIGGVRTLLMEGARTNVALWCRDLTNAAWTKTNCTPVKNQTGIDGVVNSASAITATANNATCLQAITLASSARFQSVYVKTVSGATACQMTTDNGATWTTVTVGLAWARVTIPTQTLANPTIGFRLVTNGDAIAFDYVQNENGTFESSPIATTTVSVTRNADALYFSYTGTPVGSTYFTKHIRPTALAAGGAATLMMISNASPDSPLLLMRHEGTVAVRCYTHNGIASVEESVGAPGAGDTMETILQLAASGTVTAFASINGGASSTVGPSAANALAAAWSAPTRVYVGCSPSAGQELFGGIEAVRVIAGTGGGADSSLSQMRALVYDSGWFQPWPAGGYTLEDVQGVNIPAFQIVPAPGTLMRYVSVQIDDAVNTDGYVDLARLVVAGGFQPELNFDQGSSEGFAHSSTEAETDGGSLIVDARPLRRTLSATFSNLEEVEVYATLRKLTRVAGIKGQFFLVLNPSADPSVLWEQAYLAKLRAISPIKFAFMTRQTVPVEAEEVL